MRHFYTNLRTQLVFFIFLVAGTLAVQGQNYVTTGNSTNWEDPLAWTCTNGNCNRNPYPNTDISGSVTINHDLDYTSNPPINIMNGGELIVNGVTFNNSSNLNVRAGGSFQALGATITIGPGVLNVDGAFMLTNSLMEKDGNVVNNTEITMSNACFTLLSGNFNNYGVISGVGGVKTLSGNINNLGTWDSQVLYYYSNNGSGFTEPASTLEEVNAICDCILTNCDIQWAFDYREFKVNGKLSNALVTLTQEWDNNPEDFNEFVYNIVAGKVLVEIVVQEGFYSSLLTELTSLGVTASDFLPDFFDPADEQRVVACYVPIVTSTGGPNLILLDTSPNVNRVYEGSRGIPGAITNQGDIAQESFVARLGWNVTGAGVKIGVISDSYDNKNKANDDQVNEDLPGPLNPDPTQQTPVTVLQDLASGGTDEGRAMLQLVHDVAPGAQLYFASGFLSEYNMAAQIAALIAAGCDIVVDDVQYMKEPFYKDGVLAQAVDAAAASGIHTFTSAGNFGSRSYEATFTPAPAPNDNRHDFGGTHLQELTLNPGFYAISLQWNDNYYSLGEGGALIDLDIYLANSSSIIQFGSNWANLGADPIEFMYFFVLEPTTTNILIERAPGSLASPVDLKYVVFRAGDDGQFAATPALNSSTLVGHANAELNTAVGAVRFDNTPAYGGALLAQQSSSRGGTTTNGIVRTQPILMGPTGGETSVDLGGADFSGDGATNGYNFFGTSASAPNVAAAAALIIEEKINVGLGASPDPNLTVRNLLTSTALDMLTPGHDYTSGYGFVQVDAALGAFSNPTPNLLSLNIQDLLDQDPTYEPGDASFTLVVEGEFFVDGESTVYWRGDALTTTYIDENSLSVEIPEFIGTGGEITVLTNSAEGTTPDSNGGLSNPLTFYDIEKTDVIVVANDTTRLYGTDNPDFTFTVLNADTGLPLPQEDLDLFLDPANFAVDWITAAVPTSNVGDYQIVIRGINPTTSALELFDIDTHVNIGLTELYNITVQSGIMTIDPMPVTITPIIPDEITYGQPLTENIEFEYIYGTPGGEAVVLNATAASQFEDRHTNGGLGFVNGGLGFVNGGLGFVNTGLGFVNNQNGDWYINDVNVSDVNFWVTESTLNQSETITNGGLGFVNGGLGFVNVGGLGFVNNSGPLVNIGLDLFDMQNLQLNNMVPSTIVNGGLGFVNGGLGFVNTGLGFVNGNQLPTLNGGLGFVNGGLGFVNQSAFLNGLGFVNGGLGFVNGGMGFVNTGLGFVNGGLGFVNSDSYDSTLLNGGLGFVNSSDGQEYVLSNSQSDPIKSVLGKALIIVNTGDAENTSTAVPEPAPLLEIFPIMVITNQPGQNIAIAHAIIEDNFTLYTPPVPFVILPAPLTVTSDDASGTFGDAQPEFTATIDGLVGSDTAEIVFPDGLGLGVDCTECPAGQHQVTFGPESLVSSGFYDVTFVESGLYTVGQYDITATVGDGTISYGDTGPFDFGLTLSKPGDATWTEADLPYGETVADIFGTLSYSPADGCTIPADGKTSVNPVPSTPNYNVTYVDGTLTVNNATLDLAIGFASIGLGEAIPTSFPVTPTGLVCGDATPTITSFSIYDSGGSLVTTTTPGAGSYEVRADLSTLTGYDNYDITQTYGTLVVNPTLGCNDRISLTDICKVDNGDGTVTVCFTYVNSTPYDIYIPYGSRENKFKGTSAIIEGAGDTPPSLFPANTTGQICVVTNGDNIQWEVITPGCKSASKSANGSNANPCATSFTADLGDEFEVESILNEEPVAKVSPNPVTDYLNLYVGEMEGSLKVTVYDEVGRALIVRDYGVSGIDQVELDLSGLKAGILLVRMQSGTTDEVFRIIKQ